MTSPIAGAAFEFEILDVHHHVGNAFRALGGPVDDAPDMTEDEFAAIELASRLAGNARRLFGLA